jgi:hypothetical protein
MLGSPSAKMAVVVAKMAGFGWLVGRQEGRPEGRIVILVIFFIKFLISKI